MANRIKGITVEIGGDTTGLDKSLNGINILHSHLFIRLLFYFYFQHSAQ